MATKGEKQRKTLVDFDNNRIWVPLLTQAVGPLLLDAARERLLADKPRNAEDALRLLFCCTSRQEIVKATIEWIRGTKVASYHGSRLTDSEVDSIRSVGLLPLEAPARRKRLSRALSSHPRWKEEELDSALLDHGPGNRAGYREGQVHLTLSCYGLRHGFNQYLHYGSDFDRHVAYTLLGDDGMELLRKDGKARIVQIAVPGDVALDRVNRYFTVEERLARGEVPYLVAEFLLAWSYTLANPDFDCGTLKVDCGMVFRETVLPDWIINIETLPDDHLPL